ncbi:TIGR03279 family radical SAM protein [Lyngbya confervoides]|uniref:TIGR03279 family radical SAM protein n=1 Tax=Lyngbya confervoides BDU141951 TaxID=1574623 RepID=A0ABD4T177_9CYAN|nr:TIGR03279 family radical SAM protein [Lyngbya confervoides]MCM1982521.1 TIGR03279 family radical SAM protein [Lyngbya confervoides BDU141951]
MGLSTIQPAKITRVLPQSIAEEVGFEAGDRLVSINQQQPRDLIDYKFLCADEWLELEVIDCNGHQHRVEIEKDFDQDLGLEFESALFDQLIQCNNRCPFCFIDQQPPGKRETLYLKDDDYRLSFLYGSYLTLTNLTAREWRRIEQLRLSPLYVSVHATEPEVRRRLLKNERAGEILQQLTWFRERRLQIHAQVVLCPGINDGVHLERTLLDLAQFHQGDLPTVSSVAVVPVGLTRFRPAEDDLVAVTPVKAREVIQQVEQLQHQFQDRFNSHFAWLADEWFLLAGQPLPPASFYEGYPQIDNGVGSIRLFLEQFQRAAHSLPDQVSPPRHLTWVVGNTVEKAFAPIVSQLNAVQGLTVHLAALNSLYWGQSMTVTGLLTGFDLIHHLQDQPLGDALLLPSLMLKHGTEQFLDDQTLDQVAATLNTSIQVVQGGAQALIEACIQFPAVAR